MNMLTSLKDICLGNLYFFIVVHKYTFKEVVSFYCHKLNRYCIGVISQMDTEYVWGANHKVTYQIKYINNGHIGATWIPESEIHSLKNKLYNYDYN